MNSKLFTVVTSRSESGRWVVLEGEEENRKETKGLDLYP